MALAEFYVAALMPLVAVFEAYTKATGHSPVLVGGAATAIYTDGLFLSGDFDVVAASDQVFDAGMLVQGFVREDRAGRLKVGFYHPDHLDFGYQQVTGPLFDGRADHSRLVLVRLTDDGRGIVLPAIEDMIADRLAQHSVASLTDMSRLLQAQALFRFAETIDMSYLLSRISEEGGDPALLGI